MENKILQACKIISRLGSNYDLYDWHKACIEIMDLGITVSFLQQYISNEPEAALGEIEKGNYSAAANYIYNFIDWHSLNISFVKEVSFLIDKFIQVAGTNN